MYGPFSVFCVLFVFNIGGEVADSMMGFFMEFLSTSANGT
jgi:hypothetical protein